MSEPLHYHLPKELISWAVTLATWTMRSNVYGVDGDIGSCDVGELAVYVYETLPVDRDGT
jgi:hypothetical protein